LSTFIILIRTNFHRVCQCASHGEGDAKVEAHIPRVDSSLI